MVPAQAIKAGSEEVGATVAGVEKGRARRFLHRPFDVPRAAATAGFTPVLPPPDVAGGTPVLSIVGRIDVTQRISTRALADALRREGVTDLAVPAEWDGTTLRAVIGPLVAASYPGEVEVLQTVPIRLEMPAAFPLERFAEIAFRAGGLPWAEARQLAMEYARQPAWLLDIPSDEAVVVETVTLARGAAPC